MDGSRVQIAAQCPERQCPGCTTCRTLLPDCNTVPDTVPDATWPRPEGCTGGCQHWSPVFCTATCRLLPKQEFNRPFLTSHDYGWYKGVEVRCHMVWCIAWCTCHLMPSSLDFRAPPPSPHPPP